MSEPVIIGDATPRITAIYALCENDGMVPRYVGKTVQYLHERHKQHIRAAKNGQLPVNRWIRKQIASRKTLAIKLIEYVPPMGDWASRERFWIQEYRMAGFDLLNLTDGGEGLSGHQFSQSHRSKIAAALKTGATFKCLQCGNEFWRKANQIEKGDNKFCSKPCYQKSNAGKSKPMPAGATGKGIEAARLKRIAQTHCKRGHPLSGENLFITSQGSRGCKECRKEHKRAYLAKTQK